MPFMIVKAFIQMYLSRLKLVTGKKELLCRELFRSE